MKVRGAATGVTGVADDLTGHYAVAFTKSAVAVQVCVVMPLEARTENPDDLAAESIRADTRHDAAGRTKYGRVRGREDVDAFMSPSARPRVTPRVNKPRRATRGQWAGQ